MVNNSFTIVIYTTLLWLSFSSILARGLKNTLFSILTKDSIYIVSTPYCSLGSLGNTTVTDLKTDSLLYILNRCLPHDTFFSADGYQRIEISTLGAKVYFKDFLLKSYSDEELSVVPNENLLSQMERKRNYCTGGIWWLECFMIEDVLYIFKCDRVLAKIDLTKPKNEIPIRNQSLNSEEYNQLKNTRDLRTVYYDDDFESPYKEAHIFSRKKKTVEIEIQDLAERLTDRTLNLCIVVLFEGCKPQLLTYIETQSSFYLTPFIHNNHEDYLFKYADSELLLSIKQYVEESKNWRCEIPKKIDKWAFSYLITINY